MRELIVETPSTRAIQELARKQGALPMFDDGIEKVKRGLTTLTEVVRVVLPPSRGKHEGGHEGS